MHTQLIWYAKGRFSRKDTDLQKFLDDKSEKGCSKITFEVGMKSKKSPSAYVLNLRIRLKRRAMFWFDSADSYDVKEDSKHTCLVLGT